MKTKYWSQNSCKTRSENANRDFLRNAPLPPPPAPATPKKSLTEEFRSPQKILTYLKKVESSKKIWPTKPRKNYDPRNKIFNPRNPSNSPTNLTHGTHAPTQHSLPRNPRDLADSIESKKSATLQRFISFFKVILFYLLTWCLFYIPSNSWSYFRNKWQ